MRCFYCDGTGKYEEPINEDMFDDFYEKYDSMGCFSAEQCREKALDKSGRKLIICPKCNGTGSDQNM